MPFKINPSSMLSALVILYSFNLFIVYNGIHILHSEVFLRLENDQSSFKVAVTIGLASKTTYVQL